MIFFTSYWQTKKRPAILAVVADVETAFPLDRIAGTVCCVQYALPVLRRQRMPEGIFSNRRLCKRNTEIYGATVLLKAANPAEIGCDDLSNHPSAHRLFFIMSAYTNLK